MKEFDNTVKYKILSILLIIILYSCTDSLTIGDPEIILQEDLYLMVRGEITPVKYSLAEGMSKNDIKYIIEDPAVVTITNDQIYAAGKGVTSVSVTSDSHPELSGSFNVQVGDEVRLADLDLSKPVNIMYSRYGENDSDYTQAYPIPYDKITHFVLNQGKVLIDGTLKVLDEDYDAFVKKIVGEAAEHNVKVLLALCSDNGISDNDVIPYVINDDIKRRTLILNIINFINKYDLDGVGFNWEFPETEEAKNNFLKFHKEFRAVADNFPKKLVFFNTVNSIYCNNYYHDDIAKYVDFYLVMVYHYIKDKKNDYLTDRGYHFLLESADYWKTRGLPVEKTVFGVPFYGDFFIYDTAYMNEYLDVFSVRYYKINTEYPSESVNQNSMGNVTNDYFINDYASDNGLNPGNLIGFYYWNSPELIRRKAEYIKTNNYRGLFIWALYFDTYDNLLLNSLYNALY